MQRIKRTTQICLYFLAIISSVMLSMSIDSNPLLAVAIVGTTLGFIVADIWDKFHIDGWIANVASILILVLAMKDFFPSDSAGKLISVANLLVYLQIVLMFQEKTPRLNWQIMVLSLLQVVITTIFSLNFEGGLLLLLYFLFGGCSMVLQNVFAQSIDVKTANESNAKRLQTHLGITDGDPSQWETQQDTSNAAVPMSAAQRTAWSPIAILDTPGFDGRLTLKLLLSIVSLFLVSMMFTVALFLMAPRQNKPWFGPISNEVISMGLRKKIELNETGVVALSNTTVFRASIFDQRTKEKMRLSAPAYFRGAALSSLKIENGMTTWRAPYNRVIEEVYQPIPTVSSGGKTRLADVEIVLEETADPTVYGLMPFFINDETPRGIEFCHEISTITRVRENVKIDLLPYRYSFTTVITPRGAINESWPYVSNTRNYRRSPMSQDPAREAYLTEMDRERYPELCAIAEEIHAKVESRSGSRIDFVRELEDHFLNSGQYTYTLDYRKVERNISIDPVEDFVANHRQGHCTIFASAMTLMLRSQGVPARLVSGFHGGDLSELTGKYVVRANHAHAWVEVYLRPDDCTQEMNSSGGAGAGGAWLIGEPTPGTSGEDLGLGAGDAMELARTVWQDYMLGIDDEHLDADSSYAQPLINFFERLKLDDVPGTLNRVTGQVSPIGKAVCAFLFGLVMVIPLIRYLIRQAEYEEEKPATAVGKLKRFFADAIGLISPDWREWVIGQDADTAFYVRFSKTLKERGLEREPSQSHREFAQQTIEHFAEHSALDKIEATVALVTERFNEVRFGKAQLEASERKEIESQLDDFDDCLRTSV